MQVRELNEGEWPLWRKLAIAAVTESPDAFRPTLDENLARTDEEWADLIDPAVRHPRGGLWVADLDNEPVGMVFARIDETYTVTEFGSMWVAPIARGSGVGSALLEAVETRACEQGTPVLECRVSQGNDPALGLYQKYGLIETDETQLLSDGSSVTVRKMQAQLTSRP
jgi:ribosomal protein S18 acetylase RimI-like enzyme